TDQEAEQQEKLRNVLSNMESKEKNLQEPKTDILAKEQNLSAQQKATQEYINKIRSYESEKKIKNAQLQHLQEKQIRRSHHLQNDKQQLNHVQYQIKRLNEELFEEQNSLDVVKQDLDTNKIEVEELRAQQSSAKTKLDEFSKNSQALQSQIYALEKELAVL